MTPEQFLEQMLDVLNREEPIGIDDALADIEEWDSIAYVAFLGMIAEYTDKPIRAAQIRDSVTVRDLYNLIAKE